MWIKSHHLYASNSPISYLLLFNMASKALYYLSPVHLLWPHFLPFSSLLTIVEHTGFLFFVLQGHLPLFCLLAFAWLQIVLYRWSSFSLSSNVTSSDFTTTPHAQLHYPVPLSSLYLKFPYLCIYSLVIISWLPQQKVHSVTEVILCDCDAAQGGWTQ